MKITDAIAVGNLWVAEYTRRAEVLATHLDLHIKAMDAMEGRDELSPGTRGLMLAADEMLIHIVERECGNSAPCQCGEVDADTTPLEPRGPVDITMPSPGPWSPAPYGLSLDERPICSTVQDKNGACVKGLLICAGMDQTDAALANVNLVLAAPRLLSSLMRVARLLHVFQETSLFKFAQGDSLHDPALLQNIDEVLEAATPIRRPKPSTEGGAA